MLVEQKTNYELKIQNLERENDEFEAEKDTLTAQFEDAKLEYERNISAALESKNLEITRLQNEIVESNNQFANEHRKWQTSIAKVEVSF